MIVVIQTSRRIARSQSPRWLAAVCASLGFHTVAFATAAAVWLWWGESDERVKFAGSQRAVTVEASWSEIVPPAFEVEQLEAPVEVSPRTARIERRQFVETQSAASPVELTDLSTEVAIPPLESAEWRSSAAADAAPVLQTQTITTPARANSTPPPTISSVAVVPQSLGTDTIEPPRFLHNRPPNYPDQARLQRWQGVVLLRLSIDATGRVTEVGVARSSGYALLDAEAVQAVRQWRAIPAKRNGQPVATEEVLPVRFVLD